MHDKTKQRIREHEGYRTTPYRDSEKVWTVGIGRNIEAVPFEDDEIQLMFRNDFRRAHDDALKLPGYLALNEVRRGVLIEMVFQMGLAGVRKFVKFIEAYQNKEWENASKEMLDSKWARQTPKRAERLAAIFRSGEYDDEMATASYSPDDFRLRD